MLVLLSLEHWRPDSATHTGTAGIKALEKEAGVEVKGRIAPSEISASIKPALFGGANG